MMTKHEVKRMTTMIAMTKALGKVLTILADPTLTEEEAAINWHHAEMLCEILGLLGRREYVKAMEVHKLLVNSIDAAHLYLGTVRGTP